MFYQNTSHYYILKVNMQPRNSGLFQWLPLFKRLVTVAAYKDFVDVLRYLAWPDSLSVIRREMYNLAFFWMLQKLDTRSKRWLEQR